jgi:phage/plasmid primase-like uncharacterized protein
MNIIYQYPEQTLETAEQALSCIPADLPRNDWIKIATALKTEFGDAARETFLTWSSQADSYQRQHAISTWKSIQTGSVNIGTLYWYAKQYGYTPEKRTVNAHEKKQFAKEAEQRRIAQEKRAAQEKAQTKADQQRAKQAIDEIIPFLTPASPDDPYLKNKHSNGEGAYILDTNDLPKHSKARYTYPINEIANTKSGKALIIPFQNAQGDYVGMQCIYGGKKRYVKGSISKGSFAHLSNILPTTDTTVTFAIGEGYATVNSYQQAFPDHFAVMAKDANNLPIVAELIQARYPHATIIILADNDESGVGQKKAEEAARLVNGTLLMPKRIAHDKNTDWNDVHLQHGLDALTYEINFINNIPMVSKTTDISSLESLRQSINYQDAYKRIQMAQAMDQSTVDICHCYSLEGTVAAIDLGITSIKLHQDMKAGKTFLVGWLQKHHPEINNTLYMSHLASINESTTARLSEIFGLTFVSYNDLEMGAHPEGVGTTFNSLPTVLHKMSTIAFDLVNLDEIEGAASFMAHGTISNRAQAGDALREVMQQAKIVIVSDAHMGANTETFLKTFIPHRIFTTIENHYQHWKGLQYTWIESKEEGLAYLKQRLLSNEPIFIYFTSAELADKTYEMCRKEGLFEGKKTLLASGSTSRNPEVIAAKKHNHLFNQYHIVFGSPTLGTGLSIEGDHFHEAMVFYSRDLRTGNSQSALQLPFRTRDITNLVCVKVDNGDYYSADAEIDRIIEDANNIVTLKNAMAKVAYNFNEVERKAYEATSTLHAFYVAEIEANNARDYQHFFDNIQCEFDKKGMVNALNIEIPTTETIKEEMKAAKESLKKAEKEAILHAEDKTSNEIMALQATLSIAPESLTDNEVNALKKYDLHENFIHTDTFELLEEEAKIIALEEAWGLKEQGVDRSRRRIQAALMPTTAINRICNTWTAGIGESRLMQKDIASNSAVHLKATTEVDRLLMKYLGLIEDENGDIIMEDDILINNSIARGEKKGNFTINIKKLMKGFNAITSTRLITLTKIKRQPARLLANLIRDRLGITVKKIRKPQISVVKRQTINSEECAFPELAAAIIKPLNLKENGRMSAKNHVEINATLLDESGFLAAITPEVREHYNHNKSGTMKKITQKQIDDHPVSLFKRLASSLLGVRFEKIKAQDEWLIPTNQLVINNLNLASGKGLNNLLNLNSSISAELCLTQSDFIDEEIKRQLNITCSTEQHIKKCLKMIPVEHHHATMRTYIEKASEEKNSASRFTSLAQANLFLLDKASSKKEQITRKKSPSLPPFSDVGFWWQNSGGKVADNRIVVPISP